MKIKKNTIEIGTLLVVTWLDACRGRELDELTEGLVNVTCGFLVKFGKECIHIAQEKSIEGQNCDQYRDITTIPYAIVKEIEVVKE